MVGTFIYQLSHLYNYMVFVSAIDHRNLVSIYPLTIYLNPSDSFLHTFRFMDLNMIIRPSKNDDSLLKIAKTFPEGQGSTIKPSYPGRIPRSACDRFINVHAAVPVSQLFLPLQILVHQLPRSSANIHMVLSGEYHWFPQYKMDIFYDKPQMPCFLFQAQSPQWKPTDCCGRKFLHFLYIQADKK